IANDERGRRTYLAHHFQEDSAIRGHVFAVDNITGDLDHVGQRHSGLLEQALDLRPRRPRLDFEVTGHAALTGDVECGTRNLNQDRLAEVGEAKSAFQIDFSHHHCALLFALLSGGGESVRQTNVYGSFYRSARVPKTP